MLIIVQYVSCKLYNNGGSRGGIRDVLCKDLLLLLTDNDNLGLGAVLLNSVHLNRRATEIDDNARIDDENRIVGYPPPFCN